MFGVIQKAQGIMVIFRKTVKLYATDGRIALTEVPSKMKR